jgi:hypothetical protein
VRPGGPRRTAIAPNVGSLGTSPGERPAVLLAKRPGDPAHAGQPEEDRGLAPPLPVRCRPRQTMPSAAL